MPHTGILAGPISGLRYETPRHRGSTNERGEFRYEEGERVAFLLGGNAIGNVTAAPRVHLAQIVARADGRLHKLKDSGLTNIARLVFTLGRSEIRDGGTDIPPEVHAVIGERRIDFRHDAAIRPPRSRTRFGSSPRIPSSSGCSPTSTPPASSTDHGSW